MGIQQNMADIMRIIKKESGKSIAEFSEELNISCTALQKYLNAEGNPTIKTIELLAAKMRIDPIEFMAGTFEPNQYRIIFLLLDTLQEVSSLSPIKKERFTELFLEIIHLWDEE